MYWAFSFTNADDVLWFSSKLGKNAWMVVMLGL